MRRRAKPAEATVRAARPVAHKSLKGEDSRGREREKRLAEALEHQAATSEILRLISSSPTDVQPVFETIAARALRLCDAKLCTVFRFDGDLIHLVADQNVSTEGAAAYRDAYPAPPGRGGGTHRAILTRSIVHIPDIREDAEYEHQALARANDFGCVLAVPMLRDGQPIGAITVGREAARPFPDEQIELLKTFADQAVIAIENVRLFTELEARNRDLTTALDQQTATSDVLRVISMSPTDTQPVFQAIVESAVRLCAGSVGSVMTTDEHQVHLRADVSFRPETRDAVRARFPFPLNRDSLVGRAILDGDGVHVPDFEVSGAVPESARTVARMVGYRSALAAPMFRDGRPIGLIFVGRPDPGRFSDDESRLLRTFADQAVIAIENVRLFTELQASNRELTTALDTQTATSDILRVISHSQTDVQPVFDAIVNSAVRLLRARSGTLSRIVGDQIELAAHTSTDDAGDAATRAAFPQPLSFGGVHAQTIRSRAPLNIADAQIDPRLPEATHTYAQVRGYRSQGAVPMLRHDEAVGAIAVTRREPGGFTDDEIVLLQTFADQAVIAIENARLFKELEARNRELTAALEQQTATSEILRVISSSPTDFQPVFDTIVRNAARVCGAFDAVLVLADGNEFVQRAHHGPIETVVGERYPLRGTVGGRAVGEARVVQVENIAEASDYPIGRELAQRIGYRTTLSVPLLRDGAAIGAITIRRTEVVPFSDKHIALLETFADQAVIAIENVRLFTELQARNRDLTEALEQQTATAEILRVISQAQTDVQPVFDAIVRNAVRLCGASHGGVYRFDGELVHSAAHDGYTPEQLEHWRRQWPRPVTAASVACQAIRTGRLVRIADLETAAEMHALTSDALVNLRARGARSVMAVPMFRQHEIVGAISLAHRDVDAFSDAHVELLKTFADQAVIAVENARLLTELQTRTRELTRSVGELTALGDVGRTLSSTLDLETVLQTIVTRANTLAGTAGCAIWEYDDAHGQFHLRVSHYADERDAAILGAPDRVTTIRRGQGVTTQVVERRQPVQIADIALEGAYESPIRGALLEAGHRGLLGVPLLREEQVIGVLAVTRKTPGEFEPDVVRLLSTFATQSALAIQNARLFREIEDKSRQLEVASQHKSEFLANMSHELRTPLNAVIGFSEVLGERMFGELNEKQAEYVQDINASGTHLLSLINDILDLSKIEAGRMELELADFHLPQAIENALVLVRERALRRGITLEQAIDPRLGQMRGDERKIKQVLLNLLSNAIKFTPDGGRIDVRARAADRSVEVSVSDTGVGIAAEDQEAIFEEFRQVGTAAKKVEGTGLGLALSRKFIELHGGMIWVTSQVGAGSTFTFTIPIRTGA